MFRIEKKFWDNLYQLEKNTDNETFKEWLVKLLILLERKIKKIIKVKRKKLQKLSGEHDIKELVSDRFTEHLGLFTFFDDFSKYCEAFSPDINNIANLVTLGNSFDNSKNDLNVSANSDKETLEETHNHPSLEKPSNVATLLDGRYEGKFVSLTLSTCLNVTCLKTKFLFCPRVLNLSQRLNTLTKCLLKKNLKLVAENLG